MSQTATIVSVVALIGWLILVLRNGNIRALGARKALQLAAIWAAIILGVVVVIQIISGARGG